MLDDYDELNGLHQFDDYLVYLCHTFILHLFIMIIIHH